MRISSYSELLIFSVCNFTFQRLVSPTTSHAVSHYCLRPKKTPTQNLLFNKTSYNSGSTAEMYTI